MHASVLFQEKQSFRQVWLWAIVVLVLGVFLWGIIQQVILGIPWGNDPGPDWVLLLMSLVMILIFFLIWAIRLETNITSNEISIRFFPFVKKTIAWGDVERAFVRKYRPIMEYGGWGIRWGFGGGMAYNVSGNMGLQLKLKSGKKILVGTQKPDELGLILKQIPGLNSQSPE